MESDDSDLMLLRRYWPDGDVLGLALVVAVLEKLATSLGVMSFIWATVVVLGGFASDVKRVDFWFVSILLAVQGVRILSWRHELRWKLHRMSDSIAAHSVSCWEQIPGMKRFTMYCLRFLPIIACAVLSLRGIIQLRRGRSEVAGASGGTGNLNLALRIFYALVLSEAVTLLLQHLMACYKHAYGVIWDRELWGGPDRNNRYMSDLKSFFDNAYFKYMQGGIIDGLRTDLTCYAEELLLSDGLNEQLRGARMLCNFVTNRDDKPRRLFSMSRIYNSTVTLLRLVEILGWEEEEPGRFEDIDDDGPLSCSGFLRHQVLAGTSNNRKNLRWFAADILLEFVTDSTQNVDRLATLPGGCVDSMILPLLSGRANHRQSCGTDTHSGQSGRTDDASVAIRDVEDPTPPAPDDPLYVKGLKLLVALTNRREDTCDKIVNIPGLLPKIIHFTAAEGDEAVDISLSIQVLLNLVRTEGPTGTRIRREVLKNVFILCNLRSIILLQPQDRQNNPPLLNNAIDILMYLARDDKEARGKIGCVGGIIDPLLTLFLDKDNSRAGNTLHMLSLEHRDNCNRIGEYTSQVWEKILKAVFGGHNTETEISEEGHQQAHNSAPNTPNRQLDNSNPNASNNPNGQPDKKDTIACSANILRNIFLYGSPNFSGQNHVACSALRIVAGYIFNCVDILKQKSLSHPLLKDHSLQVAGYIFNCADILKQKSLSHPLLKDHILQAQDGILQEKNELILESYLGLAVAIFKKNEKARFMFANQTLSNLVEVIKSYKKTSVTVPNTRRYAIELANLMMTFYQESIATFKSKELYDVVMSVMSTSSELESFYMFSGSIGINPHQTTMHDICMDAIQHLRS